MNRPTYIACVFAATYSFHLLTGCAAGQSIAGFQLTQIHVEPQANYAQTSGDLADDTFSSRLTTGGTCASVGVPEKHQASGVEACDLVSTGTSTRSRADRLSSWFVGGKLVFVFTREPTTAKE